MAKLITFSIVSIYLAYSVHGQEQTVNEWKDKVVLITGAANGIGKSIVEVILEEEVKYVAILDIDVVSGISVQNKMNCRYGDKVKFYYCDVRNDAMMREVFNSVIRDNGYIDVVINDAGIMRDDQYISTLLTNLGGVISGTLIAREFMSLQLGGQGGTVINMASEVALALDYTTSVYSATKAGILQFSSCIGKEEYYNRTGMRVMSICFGYTDTALPPSARSFDPELNVAFQDELAVLRNETNGIQSPHSAALGVDTMFKYGASGDVWSQMSNKPAVNITAPHQEWFEIMAPYLGLS